MKDIKINQEIENKLFKRKEIIGTLNSETAPSYTYVRKILSEKFSVPLEQIKINLVKGKFGSHEFTIKSNIYASKKDLEKTEKKSKKELNAEKSEAEEIEKQKQAKEKPLEENNESESQKEIPPLEENTEENKIEEKQE